MDILRPSRPLFWAISNFFDKFALGKLTHGVYDFIFFGSIGNFLLLIGLWVFHGLESLPLVVAVAGIAAGFLLNYSYVLYGKALFSKDTSEIIPLFQTIPVFVLIIGYLFFQEYVTLKQFVGFIMVFSGTSFLSIQKLPGAKTMIKPEFWFMLASSFLIAIAFIFMDYVLENTNLLTSMLYDTFGFSLAAISLFLHKPWREEIIQGIRAASIKKYLLFFGNDGADVLGHVSVRMALISAPSAGLVSVIGSIQPVYVLVMGYLLTLKFPNIITEDIAHTTVIKKIASIIIIFVGIIFVSL